MGFILVYVTCPDVDEARKLGETIIDERLAACCNFHGIETMYWWRGEKVKDGEVVCLFKTKRDNWDKLKTRVKELHPYETPCIIRVDASANSGYEDWIREESR